MPPKKLKGKQKEGKHAANNVEMNPPPASVAPDEIVMSSNPTQTADWANEPQQENTWGQTGAFGSGAAGWGTSTANVADTWPVPAGTGQPPGSDDSSLGQSEILQPPPSHAPSVLETIPELPTSTQFTQNKTPLSDIGESNDESEENWGNQHDPQQMWTGGEAMQSRTQGATVPVNSPPPQPAISLADAAALAHHIRKQGKTTTASEAARRMEESRRHSIDPQHSAPQDPSKAAHAVHLAASHKPVSSASAAAAAMEATHRTNHQQSNSQPRSAPGKTTWTHPKLFMPGGREPARIQPDPSWIHTGGNAWSHKHLASKSTSGVNWARPLETPWPPRPPPQPQPQSQRSSQHRKHHSYTAHPYHSQHGTSSRQHQSWQGWGKDPNWDGYQETETDSEEEDAVNIVGHGGDSWAWNQQPSSKQGTSQNKRGRKRRSDEYEGLNAGGHGGWRDEGKSPPAWQEQANDDRGKTTNDWNNGGRGGDRRISGYDQDKGGMGWTRGQDKASGWDAELNQDKGGTGWSQGQDKAPGWDANWNQDKGGTGRSQGQDKASGWDANWNQDKGGTGRSHGQDKASRWDANWNQDKGEAWGAEASKDKGSGWGEPDHSQKQGNAAWGHSGDTWGTEASGGGWDGTPNNDWNTKVSTAGGTRNAVSPQERSQILNSFLPTHHQNPQVQGHRQHQGSAIKQVHNVGTMAQNIWEAQEAGWGSDTDEDTENPRRVRFSPKASVVWGGSPRSVPAKTAVAAQQSGLTTILNDPSNVRFVESNGAALECVSNALFGNARLARERLYWLFPADKDERVANLLAWVQKMSFNLGTFSLMKFIQHQERGGLFVNAAFKMIQHPHDQALDYLTFNQLQGTMDKTLQESVAFYDPAKFAMVFVFLPSRSGNSIAIWRRKINVPDSTRHKYRGEIDAIKRSLRAPEDYVVMVDELPRKPKPKTTTIHRPGQLRKPVKIANAKATLGTSQATKKQRKWWKFFLS